MRRSTLVRALVAGALLLVTSAMPAAADTRAPETGIGVRLVDVPTASADNPRARVYIIDHVKPGAVLQRRIEVVNHDRRQSDVSVYPAGADTEKTGFVGAEGRTPNELSSWTSVDHDALVLDAGERVFVKVTIEVPVHATSGERYAVVWAQLVSGKSASGVTHISRVGIRLYLSVGSGGAPTTDFDIASLAAVRDASGVPAVQAIVRNSGELALDLTGSLTLSDGPAGLSTGAVEIPVGRTLAVGDTEPVILPLDRRLPDGPWRVKITIKSGVTTRSAEATLTFPSGPGSGPQTAVDDGHGWQIGAASAVVLLLLLALVAYRRRARRRPVGPLASTDQQP